MVRNSVPVILAVSLALPACLFAQGKSGVNRGLAGAAKAAVAGGVNRSGGIGSRGGAIRSGTGLNRAAGLQHANAEPTITLPDSTGGSGSVTETPDKTLQQRLGQAEHLRGVSAKNGNERLLDTA